MKTFNIRYTNDFELDTNIFQLEIFSENQAASYNIRCRLEFLDTYFFNQHFDFVNGQKYEFKLEKDIFASYLDIFSSKLMYYVAGFTIYTEILEHDTVIYKQQDFIKNPLSVMSDFYTLCPNLQKSQYLNPEPIIEVFKLASKEYFGEKIKFDYQSYGPQLSIELAQGGNAPFLNFFDDFIWIKQFCDSSTVLNVLKNDPEKYSGYLIYQEDYAYLTRVLTSSQISVEIFKETFTTMHQLIRD